LVVVDASVIVTALGDDGMSGERARARLRGESLAAPELIDLEVISAWRRLRIGPERASLAVSDLRRLRLARASHLPLAQRCWELRHNLTTYDAAYVALAEALDTVLLTGDRKLALASGLRCEIELIA
jgi:predicted nucleic acid-binding protein